MPAQARHRHGDRMAACATTAPRAGSLIASFDLLNCGDGELAVDVVGIELDPVADLDEHHGYAFDHAELLDRAVPQRDLACRVVDLRHLSVDQLLCLCSLHYCRGRE